MPEATKPEFEEQNLVEELGLTVQDANLSFLVGAGTSRPGFEAVSNIESMLTELDVSDGDALAVRRARASLYGHFLDGVGAPTKLVAAGEADTDVDAVIRDYQLWLQSIRRLLLRRRDSLLPKQASIFTTNVDLAIEIAGELSGVDFNDGFTGRFAPRFDSSVFGSVRSTRSLQFDRLSEAPTLNLMKLHGSFDWKVDPREPDAHVMDTRLDVLGQALAAHEETRPVLLEIHEDSKVNDLLAVDTGDIDESKLDAFLARYEALQIVNPTKQKFATTLLNHTHYDLLRLFSNELEKPNSLLFILGFSCRDEHIAALIKRAAQTNPTLQVLVLPFTHAEVGEIESRILDGGARNANIRVLAPLPAVDGKWQGNWSLDEFSRRILEAIAPRKESTEIALAKIETLKGLTRVVGE